MLVWLWMLLACDDTIFEAHGGGGGPVDGDGWCAVQQMLPSCTGCHAAEAPAGGLDLVTDPHGALVGVSSAAYGVVLVEPGDADGSLLVRKLEGTMAGDEGGIMPPGGALDAELVSAVRQWVADGADDVCDGGTTPGTGRYHPEGWAEPTVHGMALKFQTETDCRSCHGDQLQGLTGPACSACHGVGWEADCTWCHGGVDDNSGAPPEGIDDSVAVQDQVFPPHPEHLGPAGSVPHADVACETCHDVPTDALTPGHVFDDDTPGVAEVRFDGLAAGGVYDGASCTVYCHGDGQEAAAMAVDDGPRDCRSCHPDQTNDDGWRGMSGNHEDHLDKDLVCADCHGLVVDAAGAVIEPSLHVDGSVSLDVPLVVDGDRCTGACHGEMHNGRTW